MENHHDLIGKSTIRGYKWAMFNSTLLNKLWISRTPRRDRHLFHVARRPVAFCGASAAARAGPCPGSRVCGLISPLDHDDDH